jgi:hypothetical protein
MIASQVRAAPTAVQPQNGGTGLNTPPTYGQVLLGNSAGGYTLTATSSLGISGGSSASSTLLLDSNLFSGRNTFATTTVGNLNGIVVVDGVHYAKTGLGIQQAVNECANMGTSTCGTVFLPSGTYDIANQVTLKNGVSVVGAGMSSTFLVASSTIGSNSVFYYSGSTASRLLDVKISDVSIDGTHVPQTPISTFKKAIYIIYGQRILLQNIHAYGFPATCVGPDFIIDSQLDHVYADHCGVAGQNPGHNGIGIGIGDSQHENLLLSNVQANDNTDNGIMVEYVSGSSGLDSSDIDITNAVAYNNANMGFRFSSGQNISLSNCQAYGNFEGIYGLVFGSAMASPDNNTVSGCHVYNNATKGIEFYTSDASTTNTIFANNQVYGNGQEGIYLAGLHTTVTGNTVHDNGRTGIYFNQNSATTSQGLAITNNTVYNNATSSVTGENDGIRVQTSIGTTTDVVIANNRIFDSQSSATQNYDLALKQSANTSLTNIVVTGNSFGAAKTDKVLESGLTTTVEYRGNLGKADQFSSLATFLNGFIANASSTIGDGTANGGLTITGTSTSTNAYISSLLKIGNQGASLTNSKLDVGGGGSLSAAFPGGVIARFGVNQDAISGIQMENGSTGTSADFRFAIKDTGDHYFTMSQPGTGNTGTLFGLTRSAGDFLFSNGGTGRALTVGTVQAQPVIFGTNNLERMRILSGGNVGIGTTTPASALSVQGNALISGNLSIAGLTATGTASLLGGATTTSLYANGLTTCNGASNALTWSAGTFGCNSIAGGSGAAFAWTPVSYGNATSTTLGFLNGFLSTASSTINASTTITGALTLGTASTTAANGINLSGGCFAISGVCIGSSFSTGLTNTAGVVTNNLSTGIAGGQSVVGGINASDNLTLVSNNSGTPGLIYFGAAQQAWYNANQQFFQIESPGLGTAQATTSGIFMQNPTPAASGLQQASPSLVLEGQGWGTTAGTSQYTDWQLYNLPVQGTVPSTNLLFQSNINTTAFTTQMTLTSGGAVEARAALGSANTTNGNFWMPAAITVTHQTNAQFAFGGKTGVGVRSEFYGSTASVLTANDNYADVLIGNAPITEATSGNHNMLASLAVKSIGSITAGVATVSDTAALYIDGAASATVTGNNWQLYASSTDPSYFGGNLGIATTSPGSLLSIGGIANFTAATSTFYGNGGINLTGGCFAVNGTCLSATGGGSSASSTLLADTNTWSGSNAFSTITAGTWNGTAIADTYISSASTWNGKAATGSCTNQFIRSDTSSSVTCATVGASDVSLANLSATDSTLTFSGTYNGSTARTIGINLGNANTWTATSTFAVGLKVGTAGALYSNSGTTTVQDTNGVDIGNGSHGIHVIPGTSTTTIMFY